jgi:hypothetical protein
VIHSRSPRGGELKAVELGSEGGCTLDDRVLEVVVYMSGDAVEGEAKQRSDIAVCHWATVATTARAVGLCDGGASTFAGRKAAATLLALGVVRTLNKYRLLVRLPGC